MDITHWSEVNNPAARKANAKAWSDKFRADDIDPSMSVTIPLFIADSGLLTNLKRGFSQLWSKTKEQSFGALTLSQITDVMSDVLPTLKTQYLKMKRLMDVERNQWLERGGDVATKRQKLSKDENGNLSELQQEATLAGVDPSQAKYRPIFTEAAAEKRKADIAADMDRNPENTTSYEELLSEIDRIMKEESTREKRFYELKQQYNELPQAAKEVFNGERDYHNTYLDAKQAELELWIEKMPASAATKGKLIGQIKLRYETARIRSPYFPLSRFGDFWVKTKMDGTTAFDMFESEAEQKAFIKEVEGDGGIVTGHGKNFAGQTQQEGVPIAFVAEVDKLISEMGDGTGNDSVRHAIYQLYLQTLPEVSARKHHMRRRKIKGFYADQSRAFAHSVQHTANEIARIKYSSDMAEVLANNERAIKAASSDSQYQRLLDDIEIMSEYLDEAEDLSMEEINTYIASNGNLNHIARWEKFKKFKTDYTREGIADKIKLYKQALEDADTIKLKGAQTFAADAMREMNQSHKALMNPNSHWIAQALNSLGFAWFLGLTPAAAMINMVQTPVVAMPLIAAKYGWQRTSKNFARATHDFFTKTQDGKLSVLGSNLSEKEKEAFKFWYDVGLLENTLSHDTAGISDAGIERGTFKQKAMNVMSFMFHHAERANREITALAAYRAAVEFYTDGRTLNNREKEAIHQRAIQEANDLTWDSHLDYTSNNRARFLRGNVMRVVAQFKQYSQGISYLYVRQFVKAFRNENPAVRAEAKKALIGMVTMQISIAGVLGLPVVGIVIGFMQALQDIFGDDDDPMDIKGELRQALADVIGKTGGVAVTKGLVNAFTPFNIHDRLTLDGLFYRGDNRELEGRDQAYSFLKNVLGTQATILVENPLVAVSLASRGNYDRALEQIMPKFMKDIFKASRYAREEAKTLGGYTIKDMTFGESLGQLMGFSSSNLSEYYEQNNAVTKVENQQKTRRSRLIADKVEADKAGNGREVQLKINEWNKANPNNLITHLNIKQSKKSRQRYEDSRIDGRTVSKRYTGDKYDFGDF